VRRIDRAVARLVVAVTVALKPARFDGFTAVVRDGAHVWIHESRQIWVVGYKPVRDASEIDSARDGLFFVFKATHKVPKNREPWSINNRSVGDKTRPFRALDDAIEAARNAITKEAV
jgi:hypothetical protein